MKVWLVTWEWAGDHAKVNEDERVAAILSPRWSADRVRETIELLYVNSMYSPGERLSYANNRKFNPYPARFSSIGRVPWSGEIICGANPWLWARKVDIVKVENRGREEERLLWSELPKPNLERLNRSLEEPEKYLQSG